MPDDEKCVNNWKLLKDKGIEMTYPGHAMPCKIDEIV